MKYTILACLCNAVLLAILCAPAQARIVVGLIPANPLVEIDQSALTELNSKIASTTGTEITFRRFDSDADIINWLMRFQEIDAAIVAPEFIGRQPAGSLKHLVDIHTRGGTSSTLALVVRSNLSSTQLTSTKEAFLDIDKDSQGHRYLGELGLTGVTLPGERLKLQPIKTVSPVVQRVETKPLAPLKAEQPSLTSPSLKKDAALQQGPTEKAMAPKEVKGLSGKEEIVVSRADKAETTGPETTAIRMTKSQEKIPRVTTTEEEASVLPERASEEPAPVIEKPQKTSPQLVKTKSKPEKPARPAEVRGHQETKPQRDSLPTKVESAEPKEVSNKRVILFVAMVLMLVILCKVCLFFMRWRNKQKLSFDQEAPEIEPALAEKGVTKLPDTPEGSSSDEKLLVEVGMLGSGKVPALLKRCADLPEPVVLQITKGPYEKLVYFAAGQVSGALTKNAASTNKEMRWDKLGNLLVREDLITSEARDQGMALLKEEPELRFGEALLKLGLIDLAGLRHALTRLAKVTIYSLILFPEGRYQVFSGDDSLSPEESISLEINSLLREASHHQSEWTAIRQALPNLNKVLNFTPDGRDKLEKVSLSPQQEMTLSLIDDVSTINDICIGSSMMDYEVYRFLYLMVKAGVLI